jgi:hypothetical protein
VECLAEHPDLYIRRLDLAKCIIDWPIATIPHDLRDPYQWAEYGRYARHVCIKVTFACSAAVRFDHEPGVQGAHHGHRFAFGGSLEHALKGGSR